MKKVYLVPGIQTFDLVKYHDGFSVEVLTELDAYKLAHKYQHSKQTKVRKCNHADAWLVQVYN